MTDQTQFQVGETYATRGGDRVRVDTFIGPAEVIIGTMLTGSYTGHSFSWAKDGSYSARGKSDFDLLPGAPPTPIPEAPSDDKAELLAALREIVAFAKQCADFDQDNLEAGGDELAKHSLTYKQYWQDRAKISASAYARYSEIAAAAIAKAERT